MAAEPMLPAEKADVRALDVPLPGARTALVLLLGINLFNYIDRQVLAAVLPYVQDAFLADDPDPKQKLGWLTTAFMASYLVMSPVFGWLSDRVSRWLLVGVGVLLWSLASGASGLAQTYLLLLLTRCCVGIGEAAYGPTAPTVIADLYPVKVRGSVLAWFYMAIPVGGALGYVLGGLVADSALGWRWAFYLVVPPGLLLGVWALMLRDPPRGQAEADGPTARRVTLRDYRRLLRTPSYLLNTAGMTAMTFAVGGVAIWMPTYIWEREARFQFTEPILQKIQEPPRAVPADVTAKLRPLLDRSIGSKKEVEAHLKPLLTTEELAHHKERILGDTSDPTLGLVNVIFGLVIVVSGLGATLAGGKAGDALRDRYAGSYFLVSGVGMLVGFPVFLLILVTPFPWAWGLIFLACFCLFFNTGPTNTVLANVTHPSLRPAGFALNILIIHLLGDAISPPIIGAIADRSSLGMGFMVVSVTILVGGLIWLRAAKHLERDSARAATQLDGV